MASSGATSAGAITRLLEAWGEGDPEALGELIPLVYDELQQIASAYLRGERADHSWKTADLVHEAYLRLLEQKRIRWQNRHHFFGIAAQMMRWALVNHARQQVAAKRGGGAVKLNLDEALTWSAERAPELIALDDALTHLAAVDATQAQIVELRFFAGLTGKEIAQALQVSLPTVNRKWRVAQAWLYRSLCQSNPDEP